MLFRSELAPMLRTQMFLVVALLDAIAMIGVGIALYFAFATPGVGSSPHLAAELFKHMAKIEMTHVPYRGVAAGAMNDLIAGRLDAMINTTGSLLQSVRVGQVRALATSSAQRERNAPEIPTFADQAVIGRASCRERV